jgi:hypothetical protein
MVRLTIVLWNVDDDGKVGKPKTRPKELREKTKEVLDVWLNNGVLPDILLAQQVRNIHWTSPGGNHQRNPLIKGPMTAI